VGSPFDGYEVAAAMRPKDQTVEFDLDRTLSAVVALESRVADDAFTANSLGTERLGNGAVIGPNGLVLTIGYLITEAQDITLTTNDGRRVPAHPLGVDPVTGFGLCQALAPLDLPVLALGDSRRLAGGASVVIAGAGGRSHAAAGQVLTRMPFAGYWEYFLDSAIMTEPAHPHWSGAALIGPEGDLVGVGSLSLQRQTRGGISPLNMFVPIDLLPPIVDALARGQPAHPPRPWLGVLTQEMNDRVVVVGVSPRGPASRAELRIGDVILEVAGTPVSELSDFYHRLWALGDPGVVVPLKLQREGDVFDVEVRTADRTAMLRRPRPN